MLSCSKLEDVSQNCFVLDVVKFKNCRSLAVSFLMLSTSKNEEVSQNCFVFDAVNFETEEVSRNSQILKLADRQVDR